LRRILGRERNLILMPDGTRHWPLVGFHKFRDIAPVIQYQFIQHTRESIELRLVTERPLDSAEEERLRRLVQKALGHPFAVAFVYFDGKIPPAKSGKFEEFVCLVTQ
jgi:phenylacetate-CoA ligase